MRRFSPSAGTPDSVAVHNPVLLLVPGMVVLGVIAQTSASLTSHLRFDEQRVIELVVLVAVAIASISLPVLRAAALAFLVEVRRAVLAVLAVIGLGMVSAVAALEPGHALLEVSLHVLLAWLVLVIAASVRHEPRDSSTFLLLGLTLAVTIYSVGFLALPDLTPRGQGLWNRNGWGGFTNPRFLGDFYVFLVPLTVAVSLSTRLHRLIRMLAGLVGVSCWWAMVLTGGRGTMLAWVVGTAVAAVVIGRGNNVRRFVRRQAALGLVGIAAALATRVGLILAAGGNLTFGAVVDRDLTTSSGRLALWDHALDLAAENPALGVGPGHFAHREFVLTPTASAHPHSLPLQYLSEWGGPALLILLLLGAAGVARLRHEPMSEIDLPEIGTDSMLLRLAVSSSVASGLAASLVSGVGVTPTGQLLLATTLGWLIGLEVRRSSHASGSQWGPTPIAALLIMTAALAPITTTLVTATPAERLETTRRALESDDRTQLQPRFWQQGVIGLDRN